MIVVLVDGLRVDFAEEYFDLPLDMSVKDTWFPTLTGCAHLSLLTGRSPGENNIPAMRWMDKETGVKRTYFNFTDRIAKDYSGETLIDGIDSTVSIFSPVTSGFKTNIPAFGPGISHNLDTWEIFDKLAFKMLDRYWDASFKLLCLYSVDGLSHRHGTQSRRVKSACHMLNEKINDLFKKTDEEILVVSDHGLTDTKHHIDIVKILKKKGYKARGFPFYKGSQDVFVAVCGNSMAHVYLNNSVDIDRLQNLFAEIKGIDKVYTKNTGCTDNIFDSQRAGDIIITAEPGYDLRRWEFPMHHTSHGSNCEEHYRVPIFSSKTVKGEKIALPNLNALGK